MRGSSFLDYSLHEPLAMTLLEAMFPTLASKSRAGTLLRCPSATKTSPISSALRGQSQRAPGPIERDIFVIRQGRQANVRADKIPIGISVPPTTETSLQQRLYAS